MRFERVVAHAFGPFASRSLELAPALNVIFGPNESGKSSWHAALYAGLCGQRRAKGALGRDEREFRERHRPWHGERWEVGAVIRLESGQRVELRHDLDARIGSARDADLGREIAAPEIQHEGALDGARWLGLDRGSFLRTACVRQSELALLREHAEGLQDLLQRAAASAREADVSAATALQRLREFHAERVGLDRSNAVRPLRATRARAEDAKRRAEDARRLHAALERDAATLVDLEREVEAAAACVRALRADVAERAARHARERLERARALSRRFPAGPPPDGASERALLSAVAGALAAFENVPAETTVAGGETGAEIRARILALEADTGDLEVAASVSRAAARFDAAQLARERAGPSRTELRAELAASLRRRAALRRAGLALAALGALAAAAAVWFGSTLAALGAAALGALGVGLALAPSARIAARLAALDEEIAHQTRLDADVRSAADALAAALAERGAVAEPSVGEALVVYRDACARRANNRELAGELRRRLDLVCEVESARETAAAARDRAASRLRELAETCSIAPADEPAALARELRAWHEACARALDGRGDELREWLELEALLAGRSLDELEREVAELRERADAVGPAGTDIDPRSDAELRRALEAAERGHQERLARRVELAGRFDERRDALPPVAEIEEEAARAEAEHARVVELDAVLSQTIAFLEDAQEQVYRSIAPRLADDLREQLPAITRGRWVDARVDPADLGIHLAARDGVWRSAAQLSHGTREQVWLLLRIALARRLVRAGETSPLVLDDVTVHFDADRTSAALQALRAIARERQVVLFTQEAQVRDWAREHLRAPDDRLIELAPPATV